MSIQNEFTTSAPQNLFELDGDELLKPERLLVDWIELTLLTALLVIGFPLNGWVLMRLLRKWYQRKNAATTKVFLLNYIGYFRNGGQKKGKKLNQMFV